MGSGDGCAQETIFRACACCSATHLNTAIPRNCICASMGTGEAHTDVTKACTSVNNFIAGTGVLSIMLITAADKQYVHAEHGPQQQQHQITHPPSGADIWKEEKHYGPQAPQASNEFRCAVCLAPCQTALTLDALTNLRSKVGRGKGKAGPAEAHPPGDYRHGLWLQPSCSH
eukprot:scaffold17154_cov20-Tisochrysis_lutea.AAC.1